VTTTNVKQCEPGDLFVDFATELTPRIAEAFAAAGVKGVMQYTPYDNTGRAKYGSAAEAQIAHDHGMYYMLNWEIQSDRALGGYSVGSSDGRRNRAALRAMGYPETVSAPVSVDMNTLFGNIDAVAGFCKGHFETDGDEADINFSYLDTDGGRALRNKGIDVRIWIPGAFYWSPELYSVRTNLPELMRRADENPQAMCIQFPSESFQGLLRIDRNIVLKPFNVWCAPYEINPPKPPKPDVIIKEDTTMSATAILQIPGRNAQFIGQGPLLADGSVHCLFVTWYGPGPTDNPFLSDHAAAPDVVHQVTSLDTLKRDIVLLGDPAEINDSTGIWTGDEFYRVIR
jgi:hypothetical protein